MPSMPSSKQLLRRARAARRNNVSVRTIQNWEDAKEFGFPKPIIIRRCKYFDTAELDAFDAAQRAGEAAE